LNHFSFPVCCSIEKKSSISCHCVTETEILFLVAFFILVVCCDHSFLVRSSFDFVMSMIYVLGGRFSLMDDFRHCEVSILVDSSRVFFALSIIVVSRNP
jgi:hypothetical protein